MIYDGLTVGQNMRTLRTGRNMKVEDLSERLEISCSHLSQIEQGSRKMSLSLLLKVVTEFGCKVTDVLGSETEQEAEKEKETSTAQNTTLIDSRLAMLPVEKREYLTGLFTQIIDALPA